MNTTAEVLRRQEIVNGEPANPKTRKQRPPANRALSGAVRRIMPRAFTQLAFSTAVKAAQVRYGARDHGVKLERAEPSRNCLNDDLISFVAQVDSFFIGTANSEGWPHVQHRGGPAGFLKVLDDHTLAFADYAGNRQYITIGNLTENDRVILFLIDYERGRRLKIWGRGTVIDDYAVLLDRFKDTNYPAKIERVIRVDVMAWDINCRQHFPKLIRPTKAADSMA
jgi:predicted pyridoxine 5'-phosphate oxidase superfamily flavin-nucleotide-binding protein